MKIDRKWLEEKGACSDGLEWFLKEGITDPVKGIENLVKKDHWEWANWLIVRVMTRPQYLAYAIFAAEQVIEIYEKKYPDNKRPRKAIDAAKAVLIKDTPETRAAAGAAGAAAWAARAAAGDAARDAAWSAAGAAWSAAGDAWSAAGSAMDAAWSAARDARDAAGDAALNKMRTRIINYGIGLLK